MPIDWAAVNWVYVALLSGFAFLGSLIGNLLSFRSRSRRRNSVRRAVCRDVCALDVLPARHRAPGSEAGLNRAGR